MGGMAPALQAGQQSNQPAVTAEVRKAGAVMATVILVHGMWQAGWVWQPMLPALAARGHRAVAVDLPGSETWIVAGRKPPGEITLADYVDHVAAIVEAAADPVVLVGHSGGGRTIAGVAERLPDRVAHLVFVAAFMLPSGWSILDFYAAYPPPGGGTASHLHPGPIAGTTVLDPRAAEQLLFTDLDAPARGRAVARLVAQPDEPRSARLALSPTGFGRVARTYVECRRDRTIDVALQRAMQELAPCPVVSLDADHAPQMSRPDDLVAILDRIMRQPMPADT